MFWDNVAWVYVFFVNVINRKTHKTLKRIVSEQIGPDDEVLECACGTGLLSAVIAGRCKSLVATDFSENMLNRAERNCREFNNVSFRYEDINSIDYPDDSFDKLARKRFFLPLMKRIVPFGFRKGSGYGWRYTWHKDDPKDTFRFECNECIYAKTLGKRNLMKLGAMCCHADIINYGNLPYTDFIRTKTLCQGGDMCDFRFVRHDTDAEELWQRTRSILIA